jgi:glycosyltransferase involved in cell wall biosynthesis
MAGLRILVAANVPDNRTGGATRIMGFVGDRLEAAGHRLDYFYDRQAAAYGVGGKLARFTFPVAVLRHVRRAHLAGRPFDIVNVHEPQGAALLAFRGLAGRPIVVVTSHGTERRAWQLGLEEGRLGRGGPTLRSRLIYPATSLWQSALSLRLADHVFCLNEEDKAFIAARYGRQPSSITRIFPAADTAYAVAGGRRDYGGAHRLLFAGTWRKNKGIQDLVPAFAALAAQHPDLTLTVLGAGVPDDAIIGAFPEPARGRVRCRHTKTEAETVAEFAAHDVFVLPSLFEGTPLTLMEAMASGLPIVTTATCGMRDVIRDGENGLLILLRSPTAIADAVGRLIADRPLRERLGRAARDDATRRYTWDAVAVPVREAYERLSAERRR